MKPNSHQATPQQPPAIVLTLNPQGVAIQSPLSREQTIAVLLEAAKGIVLSTAPTKEQSIEVPPQEVASQLLAPVG